MFIASNKYSYKANGSPIVVKSKTGRAIYIHPNDDKSDKIFNLPDGFIVQCNCPIVATKRIELYYPTFAQLFDRYPRQNNYKLPEDFEFIYTHNPNKCSVLPQENKIIIDKKLFGSLPYPCALFILCHELGHYYYEKESYADLFAALCMLRMGFNYWDCIYTQLHVLSRSQSSYKRSNFMLKKLLKYAKRN